MADKNRRYYGDRGPRGSRTRFLMTFDITKLIIIAVVLLVVIGGAIFGIYKYNESKKPKGPGPQEVDAVSTLEKVVKNSSLSTRLSITESQPFTTRKSLKKLTTMWLTRLLLMRD